MRNTHCRVPMSKTTKVYQTFCHARRGVLPPLQSASQCVLCFVYHACKLDECREANLSKLSLSLCLSADRDLLPSADLVTFRLHWTRPRVIYEEVEVQLTSVPQTKVWVVIGQSDLTAQRPVFPFPPSGSACLVMGLRGAWTASVP